MQPADQNCMRGARTFPMTEIERLELENGRLRVLFLQLAREIVELLAKRGDHAP